MSDPQANKRKGITFGRVVTTTAPVAVLDAPFPTLRTLHWVPQNLPVTNEHRGDEPDAVAIVVTQDVLLAVNQHVGQTLSRELGGFLLGNRYRCPNSGRNYVIIDQYLKADYTEGTQVSLSFTNESWAQLQDQLTGKFMGKLLVGWYHSHPRMNVFLSAHDTTIHESRFQEPWHTALVIEPASHLGGFFCRQDGKLDPHEYVDFYELLEGDSRETVVAWANYIGSDLKSSSVPVLKKLNTKTAMTAPVATSGENTISPPGALPPPAALAQKFPAWLSGMRLWIVVGVIAILGFIAAFALVTGGSPEKPIVNVNKASDPAAERGPDPRALDALQLDVKEKTSQVDPATDRFSVDLQVSRVPEEIVQEVQQTMKVTIDDHEAEMIPRALVRDGFSLKVGAELRDIIETLKDSNRPQQVILRASFAYGGTESVIEKTLKLAPFRERDKVTSVDVKVEGTKTTRRPANARETPKQNSQKATDPVGGLKDAPDFQRPPKTDPFADEPPPDPTVKSAPQSKQTDRASNNKNEKKNDKADRSLVIDPVRELNRQLGKQGRGRHP